MEVENEAEEEGRELEKVVEVMSRCCVGESPPKPARTVEARNDEPEAKRRRRVHWMDMDPSNGRNNGLQDSVTHRMVVTNFNSGDGEGVVPTVRKTAHRTVRL